MTKQPRSIIDRNGKHTTVWMNEETPALIRPITPTPPAPGVWAEPRERFGFSRQEVRIFTEGDCWRLAHAIHDSTGWEITAIGNADETDIGDDALPKDQYWSHMVVRHPTGYLIDIEGIYEESAIIQKWEPFEGLVFEASQIPDTLRMSGSHIVMKPTKSSFRPHSVLSNTARHLPSYFAPLVASR